MKKMFIAISFIVCNVVCANTHKRSLSLGSVSSDPNLIAKVKEGIISNQPSNKDNQCNRKEDSTDTCRKAGCWCLACLATTGFTALRITYGC